MELHEFSFLIDENISNSIINLLESLKIECLSVREQGMQGTADEDLITLAENKNLVVITHDSDFGKIIFTNKEIRVGVIFLKPGHIDPLYHVETMKTLFSIKLELTIPFMLVAEKSGDHLKIRKRIL